MATLPKYGPFHRTIVKSPAEQQAAREVSKFLDRIAVENVQKGNKSAISDRTKKR